ncbi:phospholipase effector Tle1 domain-containing protein [Spartinivicinus poritis]|uniref:DUF2235 domain-containing protein n=1 Tax=Spartinivicinus poritis TaxID=2994640 RepID=A0ABT5U8B9_9GAMM|nr:DUF2235 domain-containing protein [Spartinivicinus sp. A2-2]MDE1462557.1 DUF2235 domain-containing protein [Spartinivicinus sp. A2-2]
MAKRIILCCDGTWNRPDQIDKKTKRMIPTNVVKIMRAIEPMAYSGPGLRLKIPQVVFYDPGIGTEGLIERYLGGFTGYGISRNILQAYRFLANNYCKGDDIYCFGFSRGAYTIRALCGLIGLIGLLNKNDLDLLSKAYKYYRMSPEQRFLTNEHEDYLHIKQISNNNISIRFLGVWDTVGALGIPLPFLQKLSHKYWVGFFDTKLGNNVKFARQAIAIDEKRGPFDPDLWTNSTAELSPDQNIKQVWFSGVHANVGGGYTDSYLSDQALLWMMGEASEAGLQFNAQMVSDIERYTQEIENTLDESFPAINQTYSLFYHLFDLIRLKKPGRAIGTSQRHKKGLLPALNEFIHPSVEKLMELNKNYQPENILKALDYDEIQYLGIGPGANQPQDRRIYPRINCYEPAEIDAGSGHEHIHCTIVNQSAGGAAICCEEPLKLGQVVQLNRLSNSKVGKVVWQHQDNVGIKYAA